MPRGEPQWDMSKTATVGLTLIGREAISAHPPYSPVLEEDLSRLTSNAKEANTCRNSVECVSRAIPQVTVTVTRATCAACWCWRSWRTVTEQQKMIFTDRSPAHGRPSPSPGDRAPESKPNSNGDDRWTLTSAGVGTGLCNSVDKASILAKEGTKKIGGGLGRPNSCHKLPC